MTLTSCDGALEYAVSAFGDSATLAPDEIVANGPHDFEYDGDASQIESVKWSQVSGPGTVTFTPDDSLETVITADEYGSYIIQMDATYLDGSSESTQYTFIWADGEGPSDFNIIAPTSSTSSLTPGIVWELASDDSPARYNVTVYEADCSTINQEKIGINSLSYTLEQALTDNTSYCLSVVASDSAGNKTKALNDKLIFNVDTSLAITLSGNLVPANEASDGYINFDDSSSSLPLASLTGSFVSASYTLALNEATPQTCDASQSYSESSIPTINSITMDGEYSLCAKLSDSVGNSIYVKLNPKIERDVVSPSITPGSFSLNAVLLDGDLSKAESDAATTVVATIPNATDYDILGYSFVLSAASCDSVSTYTTTLLTNDSSLGANGNYKVCAEIKDFAGNKVYESVAAGSYFDLDLTVPAITTVDLINDAADGYINTVENGNASVIVSYSGSGQTQTYYEIVTSTHSCAVAPETAWQTTVPASNTVTSAGTYKVCVKLEDSINPDALLASTNFEIDLTGPAMSAGSNFSANSSTVLAPSVGDAVSTVWSAPAGVSFSDANSPTSSVSASTDGNYTLTLTGTDAAGNTQTATTVMTWDTVGPTVSVGSDVTIGSTISKTATVGADATAVTWTKVSGPGNIVFSAPNSVTSNITADADGSYVIRLTAQDALVNTSYDEFTLTWDTSAVSVSLGSDIVAKIAAEGAITPTISQEGASPTYLWEKVSGTGNITFSPSNTSRNLTAISSDTEGDFVIRLTVTNTITTISGSDTINFKWDTTAPSFSSLNKAGDILDDYLSASERTNTTDLVSGLSGSGYDSLYYTVTTGATACSAASSYTENTIPKSNDTLISTDGDYKVCVKLSDDAGHADAYGEVTFKVDTLAPSSNSIVLDSGAIYDNDGSVDITLASSDTNPIEMYVTNTASCTSGGSWEAFSTTKNSWTLAQSNATATVYAKFRDAAGNESSCISDTIEHDDEAPTGASISIDGGASYTSSATVSLSLTATGATEMNISNTTTFAAGNWTHLQSNSRFLDTLSS